jgi:hypothetical protein
MRLFILFTAVVFALSCVSESAPRKLKPAVPAVPAVPSAASGKAKPGPLIESDLDGREFTFLSRAMEFGKTFSYLASQVPRSGNPNLRAVGDDLTKTVAGQGAVLNTVAEMRKLTIREEGEVPDKRLAAKFEKLQGVKLDKALMDAFREVDRMGVAAYELGVQSEDRTIRQLCEHTLPKVRRHLAIIEAMIGISPKQPPVKPVPQPGR